MEKIQPLNQTQDDDVQMMDANLSERLVSKVEEKRLQVRTAEHNKLMPIDQGREAYFALLAQDMLSLAEKFSKDVDEVHKLFF